LVYAALRKGCLSPGIINHYGTRVAFTFAMTRNSTSSKRGRVFRPWAEALALTMLAALLGSTAARAAAVSEPASCRTVRWRMSGWTDVTATTAVLSTLLRDLSYDATDHPAVGARDFRVDEARQHRRVSRQLDARPDQRPPTLP